MEPREKLRALYQEHWASIQGCMQQSQLLAGPILMSLSDAYFNAPKKLMIIGQQTYGWNNGTIDELLKSYEEFNFGERYYASPFWNVIAKITESIGVSRYSIAWTNLIKCDYEDGRPPLELEKKIHSAFPVLIEELNILKPDIVLFLTGPKYDNALLNTLPGAQIITVPSGKAFKLGRVQHSVLPKNAYRTYHPKYLRLSGNEEAFINFIKENCSG